MHELYDSGEHVALIRYDGDPDVFTALAWAFLATDSLARHGPIEAPRPAFYRRRFRRQYGGDDWTPVPGATGSSEPTHGVFLGAVITPARRGDDPPLFAGTLLDLRTRRWAA